MNDENNLENIKTKIRKLLALSKSDNENEAYIALKKANELISQYELDEDSLRFEFVQVKSTKTYVPWRALIGNAVAWLYCCCVFRDPKLGTIVFTGESLDVFLAGEMYTYLINTIKRYSKKTIHKNAKFKFRRDFKYVMADRIYDRIMELGESCSWAPYRKMKIEKANNYVEKTINFTCEKPKKIKLNRTAIIRGTLCGNGVSLARQAGYTPVPQIQ